MLLSAANFIKIKRFARYEYLWADPGKKPERKSAPGRLSFESCTARDILLIVLVDYVNSCLDWVQGQLDDENIFPSKIGVPFPRDFLATVKAILKRLFRIYAHLYNHHFPVLCALSIEGVLV